MMIRTRHFLLPLLPPGAFSLVCIMPQLQRLQAQSIRPCQTIFEICWLRIKFCDIYMRFLSFITFSSIVLLGLKSAGFRPISLAAFVLLLGAGISIIAFVKLGARAFYLFDPTTLSVGLVEQIQDAYLQTLPGQYRWNDPSFQNYAYQKARLGARYNKNSGGDHEQTKSAQWSTVRYPMRAISFLFSA